MRKKIKTKQYTLLTSIGILAMHLSQLVLCRPSTRRACDILNAVRSLASLCSYDVKRDSMISANPRLGKTPFSSETSSFAKLI